MIKKIKCFIFGHDWSNIAMNNLQYYEDNEYLNTQLHILRICGHCEKIQEHVCDCGYTIEKLKDLETHTYD
ncbi:MAG TPA: hypothetical protein VMX17_12500 [Candidatus Glassbacteria bacterium]|nr:hypothetical protein [Candidatus Glassbacteria bacterium]